MSFKLPVEDLSLILKHTNECFDFLRDKNIFLTGGTGFFGKWLLESFLFAKENRIFEGKVYVLSRSPETFLEKYPHFKNNSIIFIKGDISSFPLDFQADILIHMAADVSLDSSEKSLIHFQKTLDSVKQLTSWVKQSTASKVLLVSSGAAEVSSSWNPLHSSSVYTESKKMMELLFLDSLKELPCDVSIARCYSFLGPYLPIDSHFAAGNFIKDTLAQNKIVIKGTGKDLRSYMYPVDLVIWLLSILVKAKNKSIYSVGSEEKVSIAELAKLIDQLGSQKSVEVLGIHQGSLAPSCYVPQTEKIRNDLSLNILIDLRSAIKKTLKWHAEK